MGTLTLYTVWRYRRSRNPVPARATHNTVLETLWTIVVPTPSNERNVSGNGALAFASLVAEHSPLLSTKGKKVIADLLKGNLRVPYPENKTISVEADSIVCHASNVVIVNRGCDLKFGKRTIVIKGRKAHELFATIMEIGVPSSGAVGTVEVIISHVACTIDPHVIRQKNGGGSACRFDFGAQ